MVKLLAERAFAKINLFLRITGRRGGGYHELDSIFVPVSIGDRIRIEVRPAPTSTITLRCNVSSLGEPEANLAVRAAQAFLTEFGISARVMIDLEKEIPAGAGLGGGSSDAGTVLRMLTTMLPATLRQSSESSRRLDKIAASLGADVPFFLDPRPSRVTGVGEQIAPLARFPALHLVIAVPPIEVPTVAVFKALTRENWSGAANDRAVAEILCGEATGRHLVNDLEAPAMRLYPQISRLKALLQGCGSDACAMSGSGGAVFGLFRDPEASEHAAELLRAKAPDAKVFAARSL